jgi:peptidoglycan/LPS O-acetylase OafA/YrhL
VSSPAGREAGIDLLRIVAALAVLMIHIHYELVPGVALQPWIRGPARFAVPTFFALSGYFLGCSRGLPAAASQRIPRIVRVYVLACLLYLPFALIQQRPLDPLSLLTGGTWLHLWFLPALAFGLWGVNLVSRLPWARWWFWLLSAALLMALMSTDAMFVLAGGSDVQARQVVIAFRFLQALPLIWIGFWLARTDVSLRTGAAVFLGGCMLLVAQLLWYISLGVVDANPEYPVGALPITIGLIVMARHGSDRLAAHPLLSRTISHGGARWALPIYLLHPMIIVVLDRATLLLYGRSDVMVWVETVLLGPAMLAVLWVLDRYAPQVVDLLGGGSWRAPQRAGRA